MENSHENILSQKALTVYKASAGTGKTFRLAVKYIKLVIEDPTCYRRILAVTFTNKATEEMKQRILSQLYGIANGLEDSASYLHEIQALLPDYSVTLIQSRASEALSNLLHNYNYFRVETIDSFFQSVLRNLARELDLTANLRIELNDKQVEQLAVDELIEELKDDSNVLRWILGYINENIEEDKSWNVIGQIKKFGEHIFRDYYKKNQEDLKRLADDEHFFTDYTKKLQKLKAQAEEEITKYSKDFFNQLQTHNKEIADFSNGSRGVCSYFIKIQNGIYDDDALLTKTVLAGLESPNKWVKVSQQVPGNELFELVKEVFMPLLVHSEEKRKAYLTTYKSAQLTLRHMNQLRLLASIDQKVRDMNEEANRFLLSNTQHLLHELIEESDSPFIFEKIGTQLEHIMIDEFQDTSTIQWRNFKVLLEECMDHENADNMIVGDVKQSIYRWRNGDWQLLNNIQNEFKEADQKLHIEDLKINRRSERNILTFCNNFFKNAVEIESAALQAEENPEAEKLLMAYHSVEEQTVPESKADKGLVEVELYPNEEYHDKMLEKTRETVELLLSEGYEQKEIAIIVRSNSNIHDIADYFSKVLPHINIVSNEAFRLDASVANKILISAMHLLVHPDDNLAKATLAKLYQERILHTEVIDDELIAHKEGYSALLPKEYVDQRLRLASLPLHDLAEELFQIFQLDRCSVESAFICSFYDQIDKFLQNNASDIDGFVTSWNETLHEKTIQGEDVNGIRLLTIHKSKGLEFDNVLMPFCDWKLEKSNTIWCKAEQAPFNELPIVPIDFSAKQMKGTIYEKEYQHEHLQNVVDNMNLLYVGFTRAKKNLFVLGKRNAGGSRSYTIEQVITSQDFAGVSVEDTDKHDPIAYRYGELLVPVRSANNNHESTVTQNIFLQDEDSTEISIKSFPKNFTFKQSNRSKDFISADEDDETKQNNYIHTGTILHQIFSTIRTTDDIPQSLKSLELEGVLYGNDISKEAIIKMLHERLNSPKVREWYSDRWRLFNECSILTIDPEDNSVREYRPDRVMTDGNEIIVVDYKFGKPKDTYQDQVGKYMQLLCDMGYQNIKGYLWYVYINKIIEVK